MSGKKNGTDFDIMKDILCESNYFNWLVEYTYDGVEIQISCENCDGYGVIKFDSDGRIL